MTQKNVTKITYWLNVKILTFSAYLVRYTKVNRKILILCHKVLKRITTYIKRIGLYRAEIDKYIRLYPDKIYKNIYETRLYNAFA